MSSPYVLEEDENDPPLATEPNPDRATVGDTGALKDDAVPRVMIGADDVDVNGIAPGADPPE